MPYIPRPKKRCAFDGCEKLVRIDHEFCVPHGRRVRAKGWHVDNKDRAKMTRKSYYQQNVDSLRGYQRALRASLFVAGNEEKRLIAAMYSIKHKAAKAGTSFDEEFMRELCGSVPSTCMCCAKTLDYARKRCSTSPSFDKVVPHKGYTRGNVFITCWRCNVLKNNGTLQELADIVAYISACTRHKAAANG